MGPAPASPGHSGPGDAFTALDHAMTVVTVAAGDVRAGCLVGFHAQCSIHPLRYLVCVSVLNYTFDVAARAPAAAVHFLDGNDIGLARLFGETTGDEVDKFARWAWSPGPLGVPVLEHDGSWIAGPIVGRWPLGDHHGVVIDVTHHGGRAPRAPLMFSDTMGFAAGHPE
jgi:flavin reductase (DIM6/NTAB) family NADH-FMN oxidoreductase RutF